VKLQLGAGKRVGYMYVQYSRVRCTCSQVSYLIDLLASRKCNALNSAPNLVPLTVGSLIRGPFLHGLPQNQVCRPLLIEETLTVKSYYYLRRISYYYIARSPLVNQGLYPSTLFL
jgi:hypothetical protein